MREFKKMAVNIGFILTHCLPTNSLPLVKVSQQSNDIISITSEDLDERFSTQTCNSYMFQNPFRGIVPGSSFCKTLGLKTIDNDSWWADGIGN